MAARSKPGRVDRKQNREIRRGLVLPGGAALGAYQAGALKAIRGHGIKFHAIAATSIGVLHALAWNRGEMVMSLDKHWREDVKGFAPFDPKRLLKLKSPFQYKSSMEQVFNRYRVGQPTPSEPGHVPIFVSLTEADSGENVAFSVSAPGNSAEDREKACKATTVIPLFGDDPIEIKGKRYYDGGFTKNMPISFLDEMDLDEIWVISLVPPVARRDWAGPYHRAILRARARTRNPWLLGAAGLAAQMFNPEDPFRCSKKLVVIRPSSHGVINAKFIIRGLTFSEKNIDWLLRLGREDAEKAVRGYAAGSAS
jgi:predicted acylesterase/phospholipase RssA